MFPMKHNKVVIDGHGLNMSDEELIKAIAIYKAMRYRITEYCWGAMRIDSNLPIEHIFCEDFKEFREFKEFKDFFL